MWMNERQYDNIRIDALVKDRSCSSVLSMEFMQSGTAFFHRQK